MSADRPRARRALSGALLAASLAMGALLTAGQAAAQTAQGAQAPESYTTDGNNVDIIRGTFNLSVTDVAIGPQNGGLAYSRTIAGDVQRGSLDGLIEVQAVGEISPGNYIWQYSVSIGPSTSVYMTTGPTYMESQSEDGSSLQFDGVLTYTHIDAAGTVRLFDAALANPLPGPPPPPTPPLPSPPAGPGGRITQQTRPNGEQWNWHYRTGTHGAAAPVRRIQSVTSNLGYQIKFEYAFNGAPSSAGELEAFGQPTRVIALNNGVDWCDPSADSCGALTEPWPQATYARSSVTGGYRLDVTNALSQTTGYVFATDLSGLHFLTEIDWPEPGRASTTLGYGALKVTSYSDGRGTWTYDYVPDGINFQLTNVTDPNSQTTVYRARLSFGPPPGPMGGYIEMQRLNWFQDPLGNRTYTQYDSNGQLTGAIRPLGDQIQYTRDARSNITEVRRIAAPSAPASDIVETWAYPATCSNRVTCNLPTSRTDARGAVTDYTYDSVHGGLLTETLPAPTLGADRPQTRYAYQPLTAWYRTSASPTQVQASAVTLPVQVSSCATGTAPSCVGAASEVRTTTAYQAGNASTASNLLPLTVTTGSGDGALLATTTTTWTMNGDPLTVDGPLPGAADTTWYAYDVMRRNVGVIAPDPDGGGPLPYPATRTLFNADGQPIEVQQGSATAQSEGALAAMTVLSKLVTAYDAQGRKARDDAWLGTGRIGVTQYAYDNEGRPTCTAVRMNPAAYGSLPGSACTLGTEGTFGPDRITRNAYDAADRLTLVESAVGTPLEQATRTQAWTANGQVDWVEDANGNRSDYAYDGFGRLLRLSFPSTTLGAHAANPLDYEEYGYDAAGNLTSRRLRDGQTIGFAYDALNRETVKTVPDGGVADDVFSTYDNLGRRLSARFDHPTTGDGVAWTWDALGRPTTETSYGRTLTSTYDLAGRRTMLTWPDGGNWVGYSWDLANRMVFVEESPVGLSWIASYTYDALGRRTELYRGNGAVTTWAYTPNSRDYSLTHDLAGTSNDVTFSLAFNPAGQAISRETSNGSYEYPMAAMTTTAYAPDGLNQYDTVGGVTFTHDARGNLTSDGVNTYAYDVENRLTSISGGAALTLAYDPLGRLRRITTGGGVTDWLWDGDRLVAEYDGAGTLTARYAHGPGPDEPLAEWSGVSRRWLHADHQGSIIALADSTGALVGSPYTYSPYGEPDATHGYGGPRFRFTGQTSLPGAPPLWHYKARAYAPGIGRFLQTDPIGYEDSLNLYQYVGNDPFNATDPTGMAAQDQQSVCNVQCQERTNAANEAVGRAVGAATDAAGAYPVGNGVLARSAPAISLGTTIIHQVAEGAQDVANGTRTPTEAVLDRTIRGTAEFVGGGVGAFAGALWGTVEGGDAPPGVGTVVGAVGGGYFGGAIGERVGEGAGYVAVQGSRAIGQIQERASDFFRSGLQAFGNVVQRSSGYRPSGY